MTVTREEALSLPVGTRIQRQSEGGRVFSPIRRVKHGWVVEQTGEFFGLLGTAAWEVLPATGTRRK